MFDEMRNAINAAETVTSQFKWRKESVINTLDDYNNRVLNGEELTEWEEAEKRQAAIELDLINDVEKHIMKWVKTQI